MCPPLFSCFPGQVDEDMLNIFEKEILLVDLWTRDVSGKPQGGGTSRLQGKNKIVNKTKISVY